MAEVKGELLERQILTRILHLLLNSNRSISKVHISMAHLERQCWGTIITIIFVPFNIFHCLIWLELFSNQVKLHPRRGKTSCCGEKGQHHQNQHKNILYNIHLQVIRTQVLVQDHHSLFSNKYICLFFIFCLIVC